MKTYTKYLSAEISFSGHLKIVLCPLCLLSSLQKYYGGVHNFGPLTISQMHLLSIWKPENIKRDALFKGQNHGALPQSFK